MKQGTTLNQKRMVRFVLQGVALGAIVTVVVLVLTVRDDTFEQLRGVSPAYVPLLFAMVFTAWACNGARIWIMCRAAGHRLRYRQAIGVSLSTEFGIAATPGGVGGAVIRLSLLRQAGVPLTTAASLLAADAAVDVVFFSLLAPFAIHVILKDGILRGVLRNPSNLDALYGLVVVIALGAGLVLLLRSEAFHRALSRLAGATDFGRRRRLPARMRHLRIAVRRSFRRMASSLSFLWRQRKGALLLNLLVASLQWCCRYMLLPLILISLGAEHVKPLPLFIIQGALFTLSLMIVLPGGGGSVELLSALVLPNFIGPALIGVVVLVWRFFSYHLYLLGGGAMFFYVCHRLHRLFPGATEPVAAPAAPPRAGV
jgi:glycosyltransferase 2 family protein